MFGRSAMLILLWLCCIVWQCAGSPRYYYDYTRRVSPTTRPTVNRYHSNRYSRENSVSKSDKENAKFSGAANQELDDLNSEAEDESKTLVRKKLRRLTRPYGYGFGYGYGYSNPCLPYGRQANSRKSDAEQGRFLFDLNVYNVHTGPSGCYGGGGGGGLGGLGGLGSLGGLLSDPVAAAPPPPPQVTILPVRPFAPVANWLSLFAPGILQNSLAATVPVPLANPIRPASDPQSDPAVDPNYVAPPVRRPVPNRVYYDSAGAAPVTPAQLVGGVSSTVNGIIQQLTGQVQPVYQSGVYRSRQRSSYG